MWVEKGNLLNSLSPSSYHKACINSRLVDENGMNSLHIMEILPLLILRLCKWLLCLACGVNTIIFLAITVVWICKWTECFWYIARKVKTPLMILRYPDTYGKHCYVVEETKEFQKINSLYHQLQIYLWSAKAIRYWFLSL